MPEVSKDGAPTIRILSLRQGKTSSLSLVRSQTGPNLFIISFSEPDRPKPFHYLLSGARPGKTVSQSPFGRKTGPNLFTISFSDPDRAKPSHHLFLGARQGKTFSRSPFVSDTHSLLNQNGRKQKYFRIILFFQRVYHSWFLPRVLRFPILAGASKLSTNQSFGYSYGLLLWPSQSLRLTSYSCGYSYGLLLRPSPSLRVTGFLWMLL